MSWEEKKDYCGLEADGVLKCFDAKDGKGGTFLEKTGKDGAFAASKLFGVVAAPSCEYKILARATLDAVKLGAVTEASGKKFALESISYTATAGGEPSFSASAKQVEDAATGETCNTFAVPAFTVDKDEVAHEIFEGAFTLTGAGCELTTCAAEISCTVSPHAVNGYPVASDVTGGHVVLTLTVGQYGDAEPTVTPGEGWDLSAPLSSSDPDSDFPTWTCALTKALAKTVAAAG